MTWKNFPIPETIVFPLLSGVILDYFIDYPVFKPGILSSGIGVFLLLTGLFLMIWSVREAGTIKLESAEQLVTSGPYSFSRNPMYLSWLVVYLGIFFLNCSFWLLILFLIAILLTHFLAVLPEERQLRKTFGEAYEIYAKDVRRYL